MLRISELAHLLPFRYPFLFIDGILEHQPGERLVAFKNLSWGEEVFQGHLPGEGIFPGSLLIEMGLQASMLALCHFTAETPRPRKVRALKVDKFKFFHPARPGDRLVIEVEVGEQALGMFATKVRIINDANQLVARGTLVVGEVAEHADQA